MPCLRHTSAVAVPASCSLRTAMICSSLNRLPLISDPPSVAGLYSNLEVIQGLRSSCIASPAGSCVWHVVGCEWTIRDWALREGWGGRPLSEEAASGVLVGALGVLQALYGA